MMPRPTWLSLLRHLLHAISARIALCWHCFCALCFALCLLFTLTWPVWFVLITALCVYMVVRGHG